MPSERRTLDELSKRGGDREAITDRYKDQAPDSIQYDFETFVEAVRTGNHDIAYLEGIAAELDDINRRAREANFLPKASEWETGYQQHLVHEYAFAIPNQAALDYLVTHDPIIELGAWNGYWAYELNRVGGDVEVYDIDPAPPSEQWYPVETGDEDILITYGDNSTLLLCWPPAGSMAYESLLLHDGDVMYIGELPGDGFKAFADLRFFDVLEGLYEHVTTVEIPSHPGCKDNLHHFRPD